MFKFQSSAIDNISEVEDGQVTITYSGGRDYTYKVAEPENFVSQLNEVIQQEESVGRFVNSAIRSEQLMSLWLFSGVLVFLRLLLQQNRQTNNFLWTKNFWPLF